MELKVSKNVELGVNEKIKLYHVTMDLGVGSKIFTPRVPKNICRGENSDIKRGLYVSKNGVTINADVNGACNILRKHFDKDVKINHKVLSNVKKLNIKHGLKKLKTRNLQSPFGIAS